ncbi:MAG: hypothetical protein AAGA45_06435 [Verrucomicrobiota bacterium]
MTLHRCLLLALITSTAVPLASMAEDTSGKSPEVVDTAGEAIIERAGQKGRIHMNIDADGNATPGGFVALTAKVDPKAMIGPKAMVLGNATVSSTVQVEGHALVGGNAQIDGYTRIFGHARVEGDAVVSGEARVFDYAIVTGSAYISQYARIGGDAFFNQGTVLRRVNKWGFNPEERAAYIKEHGLEKYYAHMKLKKH